jgi:hypothetical protein
MSFLHDLQARLWLVLRPLLAALRSRALMLLPVLLFLPLVLIPPFNQDVAAVLQFSQRWLGGERLYVDLIDINPPLIFILSCLPAWLAEHLGLSLAGAMQICMFGLGFGVWRLCWVLRERAAEGPVERAMLDLLPGLFVVLAGCDFGQREHLMALGSLPYLFDAARRAEGRSPVSARWIRLGCALLAAVMTALKPHFLAVPALVELFVLVAAPGTLGARLRDPVRFVMASAWLIYVGVVFTVFAPYPDVIVPLARELYLGLGYLSTGAVMLTQRLGVAELLLVPALVLAWRGGGALACALALAGLGAWASAVVQHKGWTYHVLPVLLFALASAGMMAARVLDRLGLVPSARAGQNMAGLLGGMMLLLVAANAETPWRQITYDDSDIADLTRLLREHASGGRVMVLSPLIAPIFPALTEAPATLSQRSMTTWMLQGAYQTCLPDGRLYREPWEMGRAEFYGFRTTAEDLARERPDAALIDTLAGTAICAAPFDFIAYFSRHPLFAEAWTHYQEVAALGRFRFYVRRD